MLELSLLVALGYFLLCLATAKWRKGIGFGGGVQNVPTNTTTTTQRELSPEQRELLSGVIPIAKDYLANPPQLYPESGIAPINPLQQQAQATLQNAATSTLPQLAGSAAGASNFLTSGQVLFPETNPALQRATQAAIAPITQQFEQSVLPNIRSDSIIAGQYGGSRQGVATNRAGEAYMRQVGDTAAGVQNQAYQQGLQAMTQGLALAPQTGQFQTYAPQVLEAVGAAGRTEEQMRLSEEIDRFIQEQIIPFTSAQQVAQLAFGIPAGSQTSNTQGQQVIQSPGINPLQLLLGVGGIAASAFSDIRLKRQVVRCGKVGRFQFYTYKLRGSESVKFGVMAHEVVRVKPEAISQRNGYLTVDYMQVIGG